jgi:small subunit ribosomal protein S6
MYPYETLFILQADLAEAQTREMIERTRRLIEGLEGTVREVDEWGVRDLAYPINKQRRGYYVLIEYNAKPEVVWELERTMKIADEVLRFVSVRQTAASQKAKKRPPAEETPVAPDEEFEGESVPEEV